MLLTDQEVCWFSTLNLGPIVKVEQFTHALTNQVFLVSLANKNKVVFKRLNLAARDLEKRVCELAVHKLASKQGLTNNVIADCQRFRVLSYIEGELLSDMSVTTDILNLLADRLTLIHQLPPQYATTQDLHGELLHLKSEINQQIDEGEFSHFLELAKTLDNESVKDTLCHGDLSLNNVLRKANGSIKVLDWEYAVLACPAYDLGFCGAINQFNQKQLGLLIECYYQKNKKDIKLSLVLLKRQCDLYFSFFCYLNNLWAMCF